MRKLILFLLGILSLQVVSAQDFEWVNAFDDYSNIGAQSSVLDDFGNVYLAGTFSDTLDIDAGPQTHLLYPSTNIGDVFLAKFNSDGHLLWADQLTCSGGAYGNYSILGPLGLDIDLDPQGNVVIGGHFRGIIDFDPGPGMVEASTAGLNDIFMAKYTSSGNLVWGKKIGSTGADESYSIKCDSFGYIYLVGRYKNSMDFDPGPGTFNLPGSSASNAFVLKLDNNGNFKWARAFSSQQYNAANNVAIDDWGNVIVTGQFGLTTDFLSGTGTSNIIAGGLMDGFVTKLDSAGNLLWAKPFKSLGVSGSQGTTVGNAVSVDETGNIYTLGIFEDSTDFDPGPGVAKLVSKGHNDVYMTKLDANGNLIWASQLGSPEDEKMAFMYGDRQGLCYITGYFKDTLDADPGIGVHLIGPSTYTGGFYIAQINANGNLDSVKVISQDYFPTLIGNGQPFSIHVNSSKDIIIPGYISNYVNFNPFQTPAILNMYGMFLVKYSLYQCEHLYVDIDSATTILCNDPVAEAYASAHGGTAPYTYSWNHLPAVNSTSASFTTPGIYGLTVTDASNCETETSVLIDGTTNTGGFDLRANLVTPTFILDQYQTLHLEAFNSLCLPASGQLKLWLAGPLSVGQVMPQADEVFNDTLIWNFSDLAGYSNSFSPSILIQTTSLLPSDGWISAYVAITPQVGDVNPENNIREYKFPILGTDVPNQKLAYPSVCSSGFVSDEPITYTIRFKNIGTEYDNVWAQHGYIVDSLDTDLDIHTVTMLGSSHPIHTEAYGNTLKIWIDSINHSTYNVDGYLIFEASLLPNLSPGTSIYNFADAYFNHAYTARTDTTLNTVYALGTFPDVSIHLQANVLSTDAIGSYQWIYCPFGYQPIPGATESSYTPTMDGPYALQLSYDGCVVRSECIEVTGTGPNLGMAPNLTETGAVYVQPNPSQGPLTLRCESGFHKAGFRILDNTGQVLQQVNLPDAFSHTSDFSTLPAGLYILDVIQNGNHQYIKWVKH